MYLLAPDTALPYALITERAEGRKHSGDYLAF